MGRWRLLVYPVETNSHDLDVKARRRGIISRTTGYPPTRIRRCLEPGPATPSQIPVTSSFIPRWGYRRLSCPAECSVIISGRPRCGKSVTITLMLLSRNRAKDTRVPARSGSETFVSVLLEPGPHVLTLGHRQERPRSFRGKGSCWIEHTRILTTLAVRIASG